MDEESVDLTPGVVWTDAQLAVVRDLAARTHRAEAALQAAHVPDATGGELREAIERMLVGHMLQPRGSTWYREVADAVLALPALRDLLAERDTLAAQVQAVEGLLRFWDLAETPASVMEIELRRTLGTPTTGGGE